MPGCRPEERLGFLLPAGMGAGRLPSLPLFVGSLGRGSRAGSMDRPTSARVERHVIGGNGMAALRADLPFSNRALGHAASVSAKQLC